MKKKKGEICFVPLRSKSEMPSLVLLCNAQPDQNQIEHLDPRKRHEQSANAVNQQIIAEQLSCTLRFVGHAAQR